MINRIDIDINVSNTTVYGIEVKYICSRFRSLGLTTTQVFDILEYCTVLYQNNVTFKDPVSEHSI